MEKTIESRNMQARMAHPTDENFKQLVSIKSLDNCYDVAIDVTNARTLFGPNRPDLRGKTVRHKPERVIPESLDIPQDSYRLHNFVNLTADFMFVNGLTFLTKLS